jgi:hypothetical protein
MFLHCVRGSLLIFIDPEMSTPEGPIRPTPTESGSEQVQAQPAAAEVKSLARLSDENLAKLNHFGAAIDAIPEIRGPIAMQLAAAGFRELVAQSQELKLELIEARKDGERWRTLYHDERVRAETLYVKSKEQPRRQRIQNIALAIGGILIGTGIPMLMVESSLVSGILLVLAGIVSLWFGSTRSWEEN